MYSTQYTSNPVDGVPAALAKPSSATRVENAGKPVLAISGTNSVWKLAQSKLWHVNSLKDLCIPHNRRSECNTPSKTYASVTTAPTIAGVGFVEPISVKSATTTCHSTFSSAGNAESEHATGARGTGCDNAKGDTQAEFTALWRCNIVTVDRKHDMRDASS